MAGPAAEQVLGNFIDVEGRLHTIPTRRAKRLVILDHLAQEFEPGRVYPETEVVEILTRFHPDHAALRRYLVDDRFLSRENNQYWRSDGGAES